MSTVTPRLQLTKPAGGDAMPLGAAQLADAYNKIDAAVGVKKFATQGAATATFNGDLILETSTGQSKLFNSPNWKNLYDPNNGKGSGQEVTNSYIDVTISPAAGNFFYFNQSVNVVSGRKYLVHYSFALSALQNGPDPNTNRGYIRLEFYADNGLLLIHDVAAYVSGIHNSRSKCLTGMFEWFPNSTGARVLGASAQIVSGDESLELNLNGSSPSMYLIDWGV